MAAVAQTRGFTGTGSRRNENRGESFSGFIGDSPRDAMIPCLAADFALTTFPLQPAALRRLFLGTPTGGRSNRSAHPQLEVVHDVRVVACT